jgi:beta-aspartyl-peptidase (threonine type)
MAEQQAAWNRGDIKAFAEGYKKSPHLVFAGKTSVDLGFDQMLARYLRSYPTAERMGQLEFSDLHFSSLGEDELTCRGAWRLQRSTDAPHGWFVLVFARFPEGWRIVLDYTSSAS